ncbi:hypothetical protein [Streptomyces sp. NPDC059466]
MQSHEKGNGGEEVGERFNAPDLNPARYIKDGSVTDVDNGE